MTVRGGTTLRLSTPKDFVLSRDACSYGYFLLEPNRWDVQRLELSRVLTLAGGPALLRVTQQGDDATAQRPSRRAGGDLVVRASRTLDAGERARAKAALARMLRLDEDPASLRAFHEREPRFAKTGRGRLFRSPTLFEDVVKTVTSCNVTWPGTIAMNRRLCEVLGDRVEDPREGPRYAFPSPQRLARARAATLRARCRCGYRDQRIIDLAKLFVRAGKRNGVDAAALEHPRTLDTHVHTLLIDLPGVGPYAAANIMQLLGRYARLPLDTESVRHGRSVLGYQGTPAAIMRRVRDHFAPLGDQAFRGYWFEMWEDYERRHGFAWTWERTSTGTLFTAAHLNKSSNVAPPAGLKNAKAKDRPWTPER